MKKIIILALLLPSLVEAQFGVYAGGGYGNGALCNEAFITPSQIYYAGSDYTWVFFPDAVSVEIRACSNTGNLKRIGKVDYKPLGVARNNATSTLYASLDNGTIVAMNTSGVVTPFSTPGIQGPVGLAVGDGALWVADKVGKAAWKVPFPSGPPVKVMEDLEGPEGIAYNKALYVADTKGSTIYKKDSAGVVTTIAGNGTAGYSGDSGPASAASLNHPLAVTVTNDGTVYIADSGNNRIRRVAGGVISTVLGNGQPNTDKRRPTATDDPLQFPVTGPTGIGSGNIPQGVGAYPGIWYGSAADGSINSLAIAKMPPLPGDASTPIPSSTVTKTPSPAPTCFPGCTP
jgi:hypothetical protein